MSRIEPSQIVEHDPPPADATPPDPSTRPPRNRAAVTCFYLGIAVWGIPIAIAVVLGPGPYRDGPVMIAAGLSLLMAAAACVITGVIAIRRNRRSRGQASGTAFAVLGLGLLGSLVLVTIVSVAVGLRAATDVLLHEDFSTETPEFSLDSDASVDLSVDDGAYRIWIKDPSAPQFVRHVFMHTVPSLSLRATVTTEPSVGMWASGLGCWNGNSGYMFLVLDGGEVVLIETIDESTAERLEMTEPIPTDALRPEGEPNRLRLDCVGGGREPTVISAWVNGEPIVSVADPDGSDSFVAVGFWMSAEAPDTVFVVDDVLATATRPEPAASPVPPIEFPPPGLVRATDCGGVFADAKEAFDAGRGTEALDVIAFGAPTLCRTLADAKATAIEHLGRSGARGLEAYLARSCAFAGPSAGIADMDLCTEVLERHPELSRG